MKTAIITGGGSGIGRATAIALANAGYHVAVLGRRPGKLQEVVSEVERGGSGLALAIATDVTEQLQVREAVEKVAKTWGRVDVLVNCAGAAPLATIADIRPDQLKEILDANISSVLFTTQSVWPLMQKQFAADRTSGTIINFSSMATRDPFPGLGIYGAAKLAVNMLTMVTAREGALHGIRAHAIAPGAVDTPMLASVLGTQKLPAEAMLQPEDVAAVVVEMVQGSLRYANGETIYLRAQAP